MVHVDLDGSIFRKHAPELRTTTIADGIAAMEEIAGDLLDDSFSTALAGEARRLGFTHVESGPLVRSSYHAAASL